MSDMVKCEKCGKMVDSRGIAMHKKHCKGNGEGKEERIDQNESVTECISCGSKVICRIDEFVEKAKKLGTVSVNDSALKKIYADGYTHVCGTCGEVLK